MSAKIEELAAKLAESERDRGNAEGRAQALAAESASNAQGLAAAEAQIERMREQVVELRSQIAVTAAVLGQAQ
jgi:chromosome segregation ATPase